MFRILIQSHSVLCKASDQTTEPRFQFSSLTLGMYLFVVMRVHSLSQCMELAEATWCREHEHASRLGYVGEDNTSWTGDL